MKLSNFDNLHLSQWQTEMCEYYCENNMKRLKKMCKRLLQVKNVSRDNENYDDLMDDAMFTLIESVLSFDNKKNDNFGGYLYKNIRNSFWEYSRDAGREKRTNYLRGSDEKVKTDKDNNPIILPSVSLDSPLKAEKDGKTRDVSEVISSGFDLEKFICDKENSEFEDWHPEMKEFLHRLSPLQQEIAILLANRYNKEEICEVLNISERTYDNSFRMICFNRNVKLIRKLAERKKNHD